MCTCESTTNMVCFPFYGDTWNSCDMQTTLGRRERRAESAARNRLLHELTFSRGSGRGPEHGSVRGCAQGFRRSRGFFQAACRPSMTSMTYSAIAIDDV